MKAIVYEKYGTTDVLEVQDVEKPTPRDDQVLIRVVAASVNRSDWESLTAKPAYVRLSGSGLLKPKRPILGSDIAGEVEAVGGNVTAFQPGDKVFGDTLYHGMGGFAEFVVVNERAPLAIKPAGLTYEHAAALPQAAVLALQGLRHGDGVQPGQKVLINGGGGGAGSFAIQMAKLQGAEVTGVDSPMKLDLMQSLGADHVLDHTSHNYTTRRRHYDRILDFTGHRSIFAKRRALAPGGSYLQVGGSVPRLIETFLVGSLLTRLGSREFRVLVAKANKDDLLTVAELVTGGTVTPAIDRSYALAEVPAALWRLGSMQALGKLVISVG